jgi:hypothetical protein
VKAYANCLEFARGKYGWIGFIDGDEFIALEKHENLKAFLADFEDYDSVALNWHVYGHNGYYEDPPGLVIELLTRRMKEPRALPKSLSRPDAIASIENAHVCNLKPSRKCVDANKRPYREELYPGKTQIAHINHYQCRSFTNWMRKPERGEAGTFPEDSPNAWRFTQQGCLRQFVSQIALNRNEHVDTSMWRHVEPVKQYLTRLRNESDNEHNRKAYPTNPGEDEQACAGKLRGNFEASVRPSLLVVFRVLRLRLVFRLSCNLFHLLRIKF